MHCLVHGLWLNALHCLLHGLWWNALHCLLHSLWWNALHPRRHDLLHTMSGVGCYLPLLLPHLVHVGVHHLVVVEHHHLLVHLHRVHAHLLRHTGLRGDSWHLRHAWLLRHTLHGNHLWVNHILRVHSWLPCRAMLLCPSLHHTRLRHHCCLSLALVLGCTCLRLHGLLGCSAHSRWWWGLL